MLGGNGFYRKPEWVDSFVKPGGVSSVVVGPRAWFFHKDETTMMIDGRWPLECGISNAFITESIS